MLCFSHPRSSVDDLEQELARLKQQVAELQHREQLHIDHSEEPPSDEPTRLLGTDPLNDAERVVDDHLRTACLAIIAIAVVFAALYYLRSMFVPLFLAIALAQVLKPMIDWLTRERKACCFHYRLPRGVAVVVAVLTAAIVVFSIGLLMAESVASFAQNADRYNTRVVQILDLGYGVYESFQADVESRTAAAADAAADAYGAAAEAAASAMSALGVESGDWFESLNGTAANVSMAEVAQAALEAQAANGTAANGTHHDRDEIYHALADAVNEINLSQLIRGFLGNAATVVEDLVYILLFLMFMLLGAAGPAEKPEPVPLPMPVSPRTSARLASNSHVKDSILRMHDAAQEQVRRYIQGKMVIAALVASVHAVVLWKVGLDLFPVFGLLTFALNFVPAVGMFISIFLPMPLVALDDAFTPNEVRLRARSPTGRDAGRPPPIASDNSCTPPEVTLVRRCSPFGLPSVSSAATVASSARHSQALLAFALPLLIGIAAKDIMEPLLIGSATRLHPVAMLLATLLWGGIWGITGMVIVRRPALSDPSNTARHARLLRCSSSSCIDLPCCADPRDVFYGCPQAVPITAVCRVYMQNIQHPLTRFLASKLAGDDQHSLGVRLHRGTSILHSPYSPACSPTAYSPTASGTRRQSLDQKLALW